MFKGINTLLILCLILIVPASIFAKSKDQILLEQINSSKTPKIKSEKLIELHLYYSYTNREKWVESIELLSKEALNSNSEELKVSLCLYVAAAYLDLGDIASFINAYELNIASKKITNTEMLHFQKHLAISYGLLKKDLNVSNLSLRHLNASKQTKINRLISEACIDRSLVMMFSQFKDSAIYYADLASMYAKRSDSKESLAKAFHHQARVFIFYQNYVDAVNKEFEFLSISRELDNNYFMLLAYGSIAEISFKVGNNFESNLYLNKAQSIALKLKDSRANAILNILSAKLLFTTNKQSKALDLIEGSYSELIKFKDNKSLGICLNLLGELATNKGDFNQATNYFNSALTYLQSPEDKNEVELIYQNIGRVYLKKGELDQAVFYCERAVENAQNLDQIASSQSYKLLSQAYSKKGDLNQALYYQSLYLAVIEKSSITKDGSKVLQLTESNLREEREILISKQKKSIQTQEMVKIEMTRNLLIVLLLVFFLIVILVFLIFRNRQNKLKQSQKESEMSQSLLRSQMNPHFIFNAMSGIQSYIYTHEPEKSSQFLVNFSRLIRLILENSSKEFIPLELEVEIIEKYLTTQKMRFEDRFEYELIIDQELLVKQVLVPPMITQPFIENAIEHGQLHTIEKGKISIQISELGDILQIVILDNGVGRKASRKVQKIKAHTSMAIDITRERIRIINQKFKTKGSLIIKDADESKEIGTEVIIKVPLKFE